MKKIVWGIIIFAIVGIQFIPSNRPEVIEENPADLLVMEEVNPEIAELLKNSCYDCHSNVSHYPWYSYVAPVSWLVAKDVNNGREELNFSTWSTLEKSNKARLISDIIDEVEEEEMPLRIYTLMHPKAKLNDEQQEQLIDWANKMGESLFK